MDNIEVKCPICGSRAYATDRGCRSLFYHCSSKEAQFWSYDRGTKDLDMAKEHWDKSIVEVPFNKDNV